MSQRSKYLVLTIAGTVVGAIAGMPAPSANAQGADGVYRCSDSFNVPLGLLEVQQSRYKWTRTDSSFSPVEAAENGSGQLAFEGPYFVPQDGPLAKWQVTGAMGDGFININNSNGALMGCRAG